MADCAGRAFTSGSFELAMALVEAEPALAMAKDCRGDTMLFCLLNSGKLYEASPEEVLRMVERLLDLGADPFEVKLSGSQPQTFFSLLGFSKVIGGEREKMALDCERLWLGKALRLCEGNPRLALKGLLSRVVFGDFTKDCAAGVPELALMCDASLPEVKAAVSAGLDKLKKALGESKGKSELEQRARELEAVAQRQELEGSAKRSRNRGASQGKPGL